MGGNIVKRLITRPNFLGLVGVVTRSLIGSQFGLESTQIRALDACRPEVGDAFL